MQERDGIIDGMICQRHKMPAEGLIQNKEHLNTRYEERRGEEGASLCISRWTKETEFSWALLKL